MGPPGKLLLKLLEAPHSPCLHLDCESAPNIHNADVQENQAWKMSAVHRGGIQIDGWSCGVQASLDAIVVPVSGGGMISGIAVAAKQLQPNIKIYAAEPAGESACIMMHDKLAEASAFCIDWTGGCPTSI